MKIPTMDEALEHSRTDRDELPEDCPFRYHDSKQWKQMSKGGDDEKAYYLNIWNSLSQLQKVVLSQHATDIIRASKKRQTFSAQIKATQTYCLVESAVSLGWSSFVLLCGAPFALITRPFNVFYMVAYFGSVYSFLFVANVAFLIAHVMGVGKFIRMLGDRQGAGWSPINWLNINIFNRKQRIIKHAREAFCSELPSFEPATKIDDLHSKRRKLQFNVDVARSILLMCTIVYERDVRFVEKAASGAISRPSLGDSDNPSEPNEGVLYLLKSEEYMYRAGYLWNLRFVSMADFRKLTGPFAGAFYDYENVGPDENPFIVIVMKGTSPDNFSEWLMDCACKFESAGDFLATGLAHNGFYNTLFPSKTSDAHVLPYMRIVETIKMIAGQAAEHTQQKYGRAKKTNLYVGGHSLGAGIAQLLYARFLESPDDLGDQVVLRDGYVFGTPRACDFKLASRVDFNMNKPMNQGRQLWRVANRAQSPIIGDIVTRVPPGFADKREIRCGLQEGSYYAYAAIGTRVDLTPNALGPPFYSIEDAPVGHNIEVYKKADESENEFARARETSKFIIPRDIVQLSMWVVTHVVPILHDHFPASYMDSLYKVQAKTAYGKLKGNKIKSKQDQHSAQHFKGGQHPTAAAPTSTTPGRDK
ncbi:hypothetical protein PTTG_03794 [Puccinia triticina 1-1 BBBD Race 1]|uniref:Lipase_3 domain-containing protein n=2 Tax=Puccinia triticina TaxID=208348 RepID=A0A0C4ESL5_PUCT1|nr:uncharacterized protein PtA15_5A121 [Puccinia triticina]OAV94571.1 hypothetical protein PTTG_03794 [Puccinia triticina 1-1 BBBD Race 1]WAQ84551.1 hypothetical protein PtA15_5A121 [Puccinia triticina]WAR57896.1 hypothetical protein PtB15_5B126 [Puccinia triticina]